MIATTVVRIAATTATTILTVGIVIRRGGTERIHMIPRLNEQMEIEQDGHGEINGGPDDTRTGGRVGGIVSTGGGGTEKEKGSEASHVRMVVPESFHSTMMTVTIIITVAVVVGCHV